MAPNIVTLRDDLREALFLNLDELGLEIIGEELVSKFLGLQLRSVFQPIIDATTDTPLGYEALLRPSIGGLEEINPAFAFSFADDQGQLIKFDRIARMLHTLNSLRLPASGALLFFNAHPKKLINVNAHGQAFERILHAHSVPTYKVVVEIAESAIETDKPLIEAVENYRNRGYHIAFDDAGGHHSNFDRLWKLSPDYVKLDRNLIHEAERNAKVRRMFPKLLEVIQELGARPVIQGIETETQHKIALDAGATLLQGYRLGKPANADFWQEPDAAELLVANL
ncbi:MAG: EAL domain-containing protein [Methylobacillus sp.]|jgi:EAL domain-containing protein (putative c-di-GMP-specific phosphodiesterase class I)|nr:EAL domain-containing protein [Methylobacillus sp.]